jgi:hypothetical protein
VTHPDWSTIASLATAGGTLVLAVSTFAAVRSANRAARAAERSLLAGLRPLLMPSRPQDAEQKILFGDGRWVHVPGGGGTAEVAVGGEVGDLSVRGQFGRDADVPAGGRADVVYLALSLRNAGTGIAVVHGWRFAPRPLLADSEHPSPEFRRQSRDLYIPAGDVGFWQAAFRDPADPQYSEAKKVVESRQPMTIDLLYGDHEGGQRVETRFSLLPRYDGKWIASAGRHHNVDRPDPR